MQVVAIDPIYNLNAVGSAAEVRMMLLRLIDYLKSKSVTAFMTAVDSGEVGDAEQAGVSSLMDVWLLVKTIEGRGERNLGLYVVKARGMAHSNQIGEFLLSDQGVVLRDAYLGQGEVLTGSARVAQEALERAMEAERKSALAVTQRAVARKRRQIEAQIAALQAELEDQTLEAEISASCDLPAAEAFAEARREIAGLRRSGT